MDKIPRLLNNDKIMGDDIHSFKLKYKNKIHTIYLKHRGIESFELQIIYPLINRLCLDAAYEMNDDQLPNEKFKETKREEYDDEFTKRWLQYRHDDYSPYSRMLEGWDFVHYFNEYFDIAWKVFLFLRCEDSSEKEKPQ